MIAPGRILLCWLCAILLGGCATLAAPNSMGTDAERAAIAARLMRDIEILSSDEFGGRAPGSAGEERTLAFLVERMQAAGLVSGTGGGTPWLAPVALVSDGPEGGNLTLYPADPRMQDAPRAPDDQAEDPSENGIADDEPRAFTSYNVIGRLPGGVPGSGAVLLMAHWDHLGYCGKNRGSRTQGDRICNGAIDNASGIAVMLELAQRLSDANTPDRDIYFLATTAEEAGLLGAWAFVRSSPLPLDTIVAAFNFDTMAVAPAGSPVGFVGEGRTALDPVVRKFIAATGRQSGDKSFADSFVERQDGWALLREGVPAILVSSTFGSRAKAGEYFRTDYHSPSDEFGDLELGGAIDDLLLNELIIRHVADAGRYARPGAR